MATTAGKQLRGVDDRFAQAPRTHLRDTRPVGMRVRDWMRQGPHAAMMLGMGAGATVVFPSIFELSLAAGVSYFFWMRRQRLRLPMMLPKSSRMPDYGNMKPDGSGPKTAEGIFFIGRSDEGEEIWASNDFARTHMLILGTTGAGKTEGLVSLATNALCWSSGFLYSDGKGDTKLYSKIYSLARMFGRDDDLLVLNFMNTGKDGAGESNTFNPFSSGPASAMTNLVVSLMDDSGSEGGMWKGRAISLMTGMLRALGDLRDRGELLLDAEALRDHLTLDRIIELNTLGEQGRISADAAKSVKAYLESLPGFNWEKARQQKPQHQTTLDQHGYLQMQFSRLLGSLVDVYGYIFKAPLGDIDLYDVVVNRRILVVLLPALSKPEDEITQLGRIIVSALKQMMGQCLGDKLEGEYEDVILNKPTESPSPYLAILDEVGYYTIPGMAVMPAQARSLGFAMIFAGQDINALKKRGGTVEKEVDAIVSNCNMKLGGKIEDPGATADLLVKSAGKVAVTRSSGYSMMANSMSNNYADRRDASVEMVDRIDWLDLKQQTEGDFHLIVADRLIRGRFFYADPPPASRLEVNRLIRVRPPRQTANDGAETAALAKKLRSDDWTASAAMKEVTPAHEITAAAAILAGARKMQHVERAAAAVAAVTATFRDGAPPAEGDEINLDDYGQAQDERAASIQAERLGALSSLRAARQGREPANPGSIDEAIFGDFRKMIAQSGGDPGEWDGQSPAGLPPAADPDRAWNEFARHEGAAAGSEEAYGLLPEQPVPEQGPLAGLVAEVPDPDGVAGQDVFVRLLEGAIRAAQEPPAPEDAARSATLKIGALWVGGADYAEVMATSDGEGAGTQEGYPEHPMAAELAADLGDIERAAGATEGEAARIAGNVAAAVDRAVDYPPVPSPEPVEADALKNEMRELLSDLGGGLDGDLDAAGGA